LNPSRRIRTGQRCTNESARFNVNAPSFAGSFEAATRRRRTERQETRRWTCHRRPSRTTRPTCSLSAWSPALPSSVSRSRASRATLEVYALRIAFRTAIVASRFRFSVKHHAWTSPSLRAALLWWRAALAGLFQRLCARCVSRRRCRPHHAHHRGQRRRLVRAGGAPRFPARQRHRCDDALLPVSQPSARIATSPRPALRCGTTSRATNTTLGGGGTGDAAARAVGASISIAAADTLVRKFGSAVKSQSIFAVEQNILCN
jgi:hypothetical protein